MRPYVQRAPGRVPVDAVCASVGQMIELDVTHVELYHPGIISSTRLYADAALNDNILTIDGEGALDGGSSEAYALDSNGMYHYCRVREALTDRGWRTHIIVVTINELTGEICHLD